MKLRDADPNTYLGRGYAYLMKALAHSLPCPICRRPREISLELYLANVAFNTAEMLAEGIDPWVPATDGATWATEKGREAIRARARA